MYALPRLVLESFYRGGKSRGLQLAWQQAFQGQYETFRLSDQHNFPALYWYGLMYLLVQSYFFKVKGKSLNKLL